MIVDKVIGKVFGTKSERVIKRLQPTVQQINALEPQMKALSDEELRAKTQEFRERIRERLSAVKVVVKAPVCRAPWAAPAAPPSDCISTTVGTTPQRFGFPSAAHSSQNSAMGEEGVMG